MSSLKGKVCVSNENCTKFIDKEQLEEYLSKGFVKGNIRDKQKEQHKKWYNNGTENILIKQGEQVPEGFVEGMYQKRPGGYSKFNYIWYTNGIEQRRIRQGDEIPEGWRKGFSDNYKENMREVIKSKGNFHLNKKGYTDEYLELYHDRDKFEVFIKENHDRSLDYFAERFNCTKGSIYAILNSYDLLSLLDNYKTNASFLEQAVIEYLKQIKPNIEVIQHDRKVLNGKELDIYLPEYKLAIECNGHYWHSYEVLNDRNYHLNKSKLAEEKGIRLIHLYSWEILTDKVKSLINVSIGLANKIYARKCIVKEISNKEANDFCDINHLQNHRSAQISFGLFYDDELIQVMTFSKSRYNKNLKNENSYEIVRSCSKLNTVVVGGLNRLLKSFIEKYNPTDIFSYCDFNKFDGKGYEKLGMTFIGYTTPDLTYIINGLPVKRNPSKYKEHEKMSDFKIYGAGSKKYSLHLSKSLI